MPDSPHPDQLQQQSLLEELEQLRHKRDRYQALLKELPELFEGKFRERSRPLLQRNQELVEEGLALRRQIRRALPEPGNGHSALPQGPPAARLPSPAALMGAAGGRGQILVIAGLVLGSLGLLHWWGLQQTPAAPPTAAAPPAAAPGASLSVRSTGPSWIEVRNSDGALLVAELLDGQRRFPLGRGLRIRSGRADLVRIQLTNQPERPLGTVDWIGWTSFEPAAAAAGKPRSQP
jgi:hypothetical protein